MNISKLDNLFLLTIGIFSTIQYPEIGGITVFSVLILLYVAMSLLTSFKSIVIPKNMLLLYFLITITISEFGLHFFTTDVMWIRNSEKKYILMLFMVMFYIILCQKKTKKIGIFLKGIYFSTIIQLVWVYLQYILHQYLNLNLNQMIFGQNSATIQYQYGRFILVGLTSNAGILAAVILYGIIFSKKLIIKILFILAAFLIGSSTPIISVGAYIIIYFVYKIIIFLMKSKISLKNIILVIIGVTVVCVVSLSITKYGIFWKESRTFESINIMISRINSVLTGKITDGSTSVHVNYYRRLPFIMAISGVFKVLFGYGIGTAGLPYAEHFILYPGIVWTPESDIIASIVSYGVIGTILYYVLLACNAVKGFKLDSKYGIFQFVIIVIGFFYNAQLNWVFLVELLLQQIILRNLTYHELDGELK